jgi:hypothetical protein
MRIRHPFSLLLLSGALAAQTVPQARVYYGQPLARGANPFTRPGLPPGVSLTPPPGATTSSPASTSLDLAGAWRSNARDLGVSTWRFEPLGGGRYRAVNEGLGSATGTATLTGARARVDWQTVDRWSGYIELTLDPSGSQATGSTSVTGSPTGSTTRQDTTMTRTSAPPVPPPPVEPARTAELAATSGIDITGAWQSNTRGAGVATWRFTPQGGGRYTAQQEGFGNATGTAVVTGSRLRVDWRTWNGYVGYDDYNLDASGNYGSGISYVTASPNGASRADITLTRGGTAPASISATTAAPVPTAPPATTASTPDITGMWSMSITGLGNSTWVFQPAARGSGRFTATEQGLGNASGSAVVFDSRVRIDWKTGDRQEGYTDVVLDASASRATGVTYVTGSPNGSTVRYDVSMTRNGTVPVPTPATDESLLGVWRGCDGRTIQFTSEGGEINGRYTDVARLAPYFTNGEIGYRHRPLGNGRYRGQDLWRYNDGRSEWRPSSITVTGNTLSDTGADSCSVTLTRTTAAQATPAATPGTVDLTGEWQSNTKNAGTAKWRFTSEGGGRYKVQQEGFGNAAGTAVVTGNRLRVDWRTWNGYVGYDDYTFHPGGDHAAGMSYVTASPNGTAQAEITLTRAGTAPLRTPVPAGTVDITGTWQMNTRNAGLSTWKFTHEGGGRWAAQQTGFGNATGNVVVVGNRIRLDWRTWNNYAGTDDLTIDASGARALGVSNITSSPNGPSRADILLTRVNVR